jgi:hypothetical protein
VAQATAVKTSLTVLALGATAWARALGAKLDQAGEVPAKGSTDPSGDTPEDVAKAQQQLKFLQWGIPILTGAILIVNARMGEQQRPTQASGGMFRRLLPGANAA